MDFLEFKKLFNSNKSHITKEEAAILERCKTANDFINVRDIRGNFLYTKDGYIFAYLQIEPVSLDLLTQKEQIHKVKRFAAEFSSEKHNYKLFSISRPVDISGVTSRLSMILRASDNLKQKELLRKEIRAVSGMAMTGEVVQRLFYMMIWERRTVDAESDLMKRINILQQKFLNCEIQTQIANQSAIVRLCNLFLNPSFVQYDDGDYNTSIPILNMGSDGS